MLILPVINHLLQQNPHIHAQMQNHAGGRLRLASPVFSVDAAIGADGFWHDGVQPPQTILVLQNSALQKMLLGNKPGVGDVLVEGDHALGMAVLTLLGDLRYRLDDDIAHWFGDAAAGEAMQLSGSLKHTLDDIHQQLATQIGDYVREPDAPVVRRQEFVSFADAVDLLRDDVARLEARLRCQGG